MAGHHRCVGEREDRMSNYQLVINHQPQSSSSGTMSSEKTKQDTDSAMNIQIRRDISRRLAEEASIIDEALIWLGNKYQSHPIEIELPQIVGGSFRFQFRLTVEEIPRGFQPPPATSHYQTDAGKLFGKPPYLSDIKVDIRTSDQIKRGEDIRLPQFDPNFFSPKHIQCRFPHCPEAKVRSPVDHDSSQSNKEDLYLCPNHQQEMTSLITEQCAEKGIIVNYKDFKSDDFDDYTSLIGWMEKAFQKFEKKALQAFFPSRTDVLLAEIFLNVRNFLIITNILLNPNDENRHSVLTPVITILRSVVERLDDAEYVKNLAYLLRQVMQTILLPFRVSYSWVSKPFLRNPGAQIGAGIGGLLGSTGAAVRFGGTSRPIALAAGIGLLCGGLLGGGIFNLREHNQNRYHMGNIGYSFAGATDGRLSMHIEEVEWPAAVQEVE